MLGSTDPPTRPPDQVFPTRSFPGARSRLLSGPVNGGPHHRPQRRDCGIGRSEALSCRRGRGVVARTGSNRTVRLAGSSTSRATTVMTITTIIDATTQPWPG